MSTPQVRQMGVADIDPYLQHLRRHYAESGAPDDIIFMPDPADLNFHWPNMRERYLKVWQAPATELGWARAWGAVIDHDVVGHVNVKCARETPHRHRAELGLGLERAFRRQGLGRELMLSLIQWCREQSEIDWLDLRVFGHNTGARTLYKSLGFEEIGTYRDWLRVKGEPIDDVSMTLSVRV